MTELPKYSYDKEADVLSISFAQEKATAAVELNPNILLRFNRAEKRAVGLTLLDYSVLAQLTKTGPRSFPLTGLADLELDWQDEVVAMLTKAPVSQILRVLTYMPSSSESMPITFLERPVDMVMA